ncbi:MAG: hypothetical protein EZS28_056366, partial [Streblomastix strix]
HRYDQEQAGNNATRMGSRSSEKTDTRIPTDCVFTTTKSITTVELESIRSTEPILQQLPQQQTQGQQPLQYPFQYSGQPMQYPMQPVQFPAILPPNPFYQR